MSPSPSKEASDYAVGYGRPPRHTRFQKGRSGNPSGRRKFSESARGQHILAQELKRTYTVREGDKIARIPASQAVIRSIVLSALKGKASAQKILFAVLEQQAEPAQNGPQNINVRFVEPNNLRLENLSDAELNGLERLLEKAESSKDLLLRHLSDAELERIARGEV